MDRFGVDVILGFEARVDTVAELCRRGRRPAWSWPHDASCYIDWIDPNLLAFSTNWHYLHITNDVLPALSDRGVTDDQIDEMLVRNPRTWFERA